MRLLAVIAVGLVAAVLAGCGNNRMHQDWDDARDAINRPFK